MKLIDSRRLTGPNLIWNQCGAVIDVSFTEQAQSVIEHWSNHVRKLMDRVGWEKEKTRIRTYPQGASLAISSPIDVMYAATEVNEWAWEAAVQSMAGSVVPDYTANAIKYRQLIEEEANPRVLAFKALAEQHNIPFMRDDDEISLGFGRFSQSWPVNALPNPASIDPSVFSSVPVGLVTGTNGKTTSVRLAAHIARCADLNVGISSTDWIAINDEIIDKGDYSGPGGARNVLRDKRADMAILETARGGLLRRGLGVNQANVALITNVAKDHMGEFGVQTLEELADVKWIVSSVLRASDLLVLNADDPLLVKRGLQSTLTIAWFSIDPDNSYIQANINAGKCACTVEAGVLIFYQGGVRHVVIEVVKIPITLEGAAYHNVENALGVVALSYALGLSVETIAHGLQTFSDQDNPGRCNLFNINGAKVIVDFAHNPHGMKAFISVARNLPAKRKLLVTGQAGDRGDDDIRLLAKESAREVGFDKIIIKLMEKYDRGRASGEAAGILRDAYINCGVDAANIRFEKEEIDAVKAAVSWAQPGDLVILFIHENRTQVLAYLAQVQEETA